MFVRRIRKLSDYAFMANVFRTLSLHKSGHKSHVNSEYQSH